MRWRACAPPGWGTLPHAPYVDPTFRAPPPLCAACHRQLIHEGRALLYGKAPNSLTMEWGSGERRQVWKEGLRVDSA